MSEKALRLKMAVEATILGSDSPVNLRDLAQLFAEDGVELSSTRKAVAESISSLQADCENRGVELVEVASGYRYQVRREQTPWLRRLTSRRPPRYSRALLETLAIVAYRQPVTHSTITEIRGVESSYRIMRTLIDRGWVREVGRLEAPGTPLLFSTAPAFLDYFNLRSLQDLPELESLEDFLESTRAEEPDDEDPAPPADQVLVAQATDESGSERSEETVEIVNSEDSSSE